MDRRKLVFLLLLFSYLLVVVAKTASSDSSALLGVKDGWENAPPDWVGFDPCGDGWEGIECTNSRVTSIRLPSMNLTGQLSGDIGSLSELIALELSYNKGLTGALPKTIGNLIKLTNLVLVGCGFTGPLPNTIGNLKRLVFLSLNSNAFSGGIPASLGNLSKLYWLDLADNQLEGSIPVSNATTPGLDNLLNARHFHFGKNRLSGQIPPRLFSSQMSLIHVLFESNQLEDEIPSTLGLVKNLEVLRLDRNFLSGPVPKNFSSLTNVQNLYLSNNKLSGPLPDLTAMAVLSYLDMSNNSFDSSDIPPWFSTLQSLTTLMMESTRLQGEIPVSLFSLSYLQTVVLKGNQLNGTLDIRTTSSNQLTLIDLESNLIDKVETEVGNSNITIILVQNPVCQETGGVRSYCTPSQTNIPYTTPMNNCLPVTCSSGQVQSPNCKCAYPYTGTLVLRSPSFSDLGDKTIYVTLEQSLMQIFRSYQVPVDSVSLSNPTKDEYVELGLEVFPSKEDRFTRTDIIYIGFLLSNQSYQPPGDYGPYFFIAHVYENFAITGETSQPSKSPNIGIIVGGAAGALVLLVLLVLAGVYAIHQKKRAKRALEESNPFGNWSAHDSNNSLPQLRGARHFSFEDLRKYTKNFSQANDIGSGGYGKVYRGTLPNGQLIAIKRAQKESMQGGLEFKTEIELLSRVHHKNIVGLVGFCFEKGEQMLIYEYIVNGPLKDALSGKSGIKLDWIRRLQIALGAARGLSYLHDLANPPIIHRDVKSANILLDERLNAKVADFGLCKLMGDGQTDHITTQVKGTMGYLDPEYYMTQQLTEKSDVYSFGVLMLELITARRPIERGRYIVKVVKQKMDKAKDLYGLHEILDSAIGSGPTLKGFERFVELAMKCVEESGTDRPAMRDVVKEIEDILQSAGANPHAGSTSPSSSIEVSKGSSRHPYSNEFFDSSGPHPHPKD